MATVSRKERRKKVVDPATGNVEWITTKVYLADYFDETGRRRNPSFALKKDADKFLREELIRIEAVKKEKGVLRKNRSKGVADGSMTIADAGELWLEHCAECTQDRDFPLERSTIREYTRYLRQYICHPTEGIGDFTLAEVIYADIKGFESRLFEMGKSRILTHKIRMALSSLYSDAIEHNLVARSPLKDAPKKKAKKKDRGKRKIVIPTKEELRALINNASPDFRPLLVTLIHTGVRISEARGLKWENADLANGVVHIKERADRFGELGPPKSEAGTRDIRMTPTLLRELKEWRLRARFKQPDDFVFPTSRGTVQSLTNIVRREFHPLQEELGILNEQGRCKYGFHALRHAAASMFIEIGMNEKELTTFMGHSTIVLTMDTYGHLFKDDEKEKAMFERLDIAFNS